MISVFDVLSSSSVIGGLNWILAKLEGMDAQLQLRELGCEIDLTEIYRQVEWTEQKN